MQIKVNFVSTIRIVLRCCYQSNFAMETLIIFGTCLLFFIGYNEAAYIPSYITPCRKSDPGFNDCALSHGQNAIPYLVKGDRKMKLRPLDPLDIPVIDINTSGHLKIHLKDSKLYGLGKMNLVHINMDLDNQKMHLDFTDPEFEIIGTYNITGQILVLPIRGNGLLKVSMYDAKVGYSFDYDLVNRNGKDYVSPRAPVVTFDAKKSTYHLENLFNGDKRLGDEMNRFLNENDDVMFKEIAPSIRETISAIAQDIVVKVLSSMPYEQLVLP